MSLKTMILAGGFETRMGPLAEMPKAMIVVHLREVCGSGLVS